jgi:hypothetical protein
MGTFSQPRGVTETALEEINTPHFLFVARLDFPLIRPLHPGTCSVSSLVLNV